MGSSKAGAAAKVGVAKRNQDGTVVETSGDFDPSPTASKWAYRLIYTILILAGFGLWKVAELLLSLI